MRVKCVLLLCLAALLSACSQNVLYYKKPAFYAYIVADLKTGDVYDEYNSLVYATPASCLKTITGALALKILGEDFKFETKLYHDVKHNNLIIKFSGDPTLSSDDLTNLLSPIKGIKFNQIILDGSAFQTQEHSPFINLEDVGTYYAQPISAINIDKNSIKLGISNTNQVLNDSGYNVTSMLERSDEPTRFRISTTNQTIEIAGNIKSDSKALELYISPRESHQYNILKMGTVLKSLDIKGTIDIKAYDTSHSTLLLTHYSEPLGEFIKPAMKISDNFVFDVLYLKLIHDALGNKIKYWEDGDKAYKALIKEHFDLDVTDAFFADGSGLARHTRIQPAQLIEIVKKASIIRGFKESLAAPREDKSTLKNSSLPDNIKAKTGSLTSIRCLCGIIEDEGSSEDKAFVIISSSFSTTDNNIKNVIENYISTYSH